MLITTLGLIRQFGLNCSKFRSNFGAANRELRRATFNAPWLKILHILSRCLVNVESITIFKVRAISHCCKLMACRLSLRQRTINNSRMHANLRFDVTNDSYNSNCLSRFCLSFNDCISDEGPNRPKLRSL